MESPKVVIGVPHLGNIPGYFVDSLGALASYPPGAISIVRVENKPIDEARNLIVRTFLENKDATHLFFMDSDMTFPREALARLLSRQKDIVGGVYFARTDTPIPHFYDFAREDERGVTWYRAKAAEYTGWLDEHPEQAAFAPNHVFTDSPHSMVQCDAIATGCLLISRRVFEAMSDPWFECWPGMMGGEDFKFCAAARSAGFDVWADLSVHCGHEVKLSFMGRTEFIDCYDIGGPDQHDFNDPVLIEAGPNGRRVVLGRQDGFEFPDKVEGYLTHVEGRKLFEAAQRVPSDGLIVELGSYKGKSTICLAQAGRKVWAVDHFEGEQLEVLDDKKSVHSDHLAGNYKDELRLNLTNAGVADNVRVIDEDTHLGPSSLGHTAIDLLFIDAAHDYQSVKADVAAWEPHMKPEGVIAFHDTNFPGVERVLTECGQRGWRHIDHAGSLVLVKRAYRERTEANA